MPLLLPRLGKLPSQFYWLGNLGNLGNSKEIQPWLYDKIQEVSSSNAEHNFAKQHSSSFKICYLRFPHLELNDLTLYFIKVPPGSETFCMTLVCCWQGHMELWVDSHDTHRLGRSGIKADTGRWCISHHAGFVDDFYLQYHAFSDRKFLTIDNKTITEVWLNQQLVLEMSVQVKAIHNNIIFIIKHHNI